MALKLLSILIWLMIALLTIFFVFLEVLLYPLYLFDRKRRIAHWLSMQWGKLVILSNPFWDFKSAGLEHLDKTKTYVIVANHQSLADIFLLYFLNAQFKWIAKDSLFNIPFLGWAMTLSGYIKLRRGEHGSIRDSFEASRRWIEKGISVIIFPEGTRSETGQMRPFKNGAFKLAVQTGVPILPIALWGTRDAIPKGSWVFSHKVKGGFTVLSPIQPAKDSADFQLLKDQTCQAILNALQSQTHSKA